MKRIIFALVFVFAFAQATLAQDIDKLIAELAEEEGVEHQVVDRSMLDAALAAAMAADSTGAMPSMPDFMKKLELVEVVAAENVSSELRPRFLKESDIYKNGGGYEVLLPVKEGKFEESDLKDILDEQAKNLNK